MPSVKQSQPDPQAYNYKEPSWVSEFVAADLGKKLSSADRAKASQMKAAVKLTKEEEAENLKHELSSWNLSELSQSILSTKDPVIRAILQDEHSKLMDLHAANAPKQSPVESSFLDKIINFVRNF